MRFTFLILFFVLLTACAAKPQNPSRTREELPGGSYTSALAEGAAKGLGAAFGMLLVAVLIH